MQEYEVTAAGQTFGLDLPFFVLATQNPIEQEGTYPLPEAQLDRFMFNVLIGYPSDKDEETIVRTTTSAMDTQLNKVMSAQEILSLQKLVRKVPVADSIIQYAVRLARATRPLENGTHEYIKNWVSWGAGPRASQYMILGAKVKAILSGRFSPSIEDVRFCAHPVLRHRIVASFNAEADGVGTTEIISRLLQDVKE
jgi:MoxR-like ATPase